MKLKDIEIVTEWQKIECSLESYKIENKLAELRGDYPSRTEVDFDRLIDRLDELKKQWKDKV